MIDKKEKLDYKIERSFKSSKSITICPYGYSENNKDVMIGSINCVECNFCKKHKTKAKYVICTASNHISKGENK